MTLKLPGIRNILTIELQPNEWGYRETRRPLFWKWSLNLSFFGGCWFPGWDLNPGGGVESTGSLATTPPWKPRPRHLIFLDPIFSMVILYFLPFLRKPHDKIYVKNLKLTLFHCSYF